MAQALLHDVRWVLGGNVLAFELDGAFARIDDARNGFENRGFARAVRAQHRADFATPHLQADAANGFDRPVSALDVEQLEYRQIADRGWGIAHMPTPVADSRRKDDTSSKVPR